MPKVYFDALRAARKIVHLLQLQFLGQDDANGSMIFVTEDCKLVVTCKMQNRNASDKLIQQCSKLALLSYHKFR